MKKRSNWMNYLCLIPFMMVLATAWVIDPNIANGVVSGKYYWFYLSMGLALLATIIAYLLNLKDIRFSVVDYLLDIIYLLTLFMAFPIGLFQGQTTQLILFILALVLYYLFRFFLYQKRWNVYVLVCFFMLTGLVEAVWGLRQLYGFTPSQHSLFLTTGSFFNPGPYAGYLAVILPMALFYILRDRHVLRAKFDKRILPFYIRYGLACVTFISILIVLPSTMSRASWISASVGCFLVLLLYFIQIQYPPLKIMELLKKHKIKLIALSFLLLSAIVIGMAGIYHLKKDSADGRAFIWKTSLQAMPNYVHIFGCGLGNFSYYYGEQQARYFSEGRGSEREQLMAENPEYAFNEYLQIYTELGELSFIPFIAILATAIYWGVKRKRIAVVGGLVSLLVFASMSYPFHVLPLLIAFVFLLSLSISRERSIDYYEEILEIFMIYYQTRKKLMITYISSFLVLFSGIIGYCLYNRYPTYAAYKGWNEAKGYYYAHSYDKALPLYTKYHPYLKDQVEFLFEEGRCLAQEGKYEESLDILYDASQMSCDPMIHNLMGKNFQTLKYYGEAKSHLTYARNLTPNRLYSSYLLARLYMETGETEKAQEMAVEVLTKKVKIDSPAVNEMKEEMRRYLNSSATIRKE